MQKMLIQMQKSQQWSFNNLQSQVDEMGSKINKTAGHAIGSHEDEIYNLAKRSAGFDDLALTSFKATERAKELQKLSLSKNSTLKHL